MKVIPGKALITTTITVNLSNTFINIVYILYYFIILFTDYDAEIIKDHAWDHDYNESFDVNCSEENFTGMF